ncbi:uncharacterized protein LOC110984781 [Acanthaster planci]|uniref:Uncharacterized protein LOC110984781 n=1 Tax=Acanthaster planci TaxID=133434 RepID=A0A8B7Z5P6_ACAPL|nr:uncharacterized protein LOC110984781 [Acanthaster planci]
MGRRQQRPWRHRRICAMTGCSHNALTCPSHSFFGFPPKSEVRRLRLWITLSGRAGRRRHDGSPWTPASSTRICACHFEGGRKCNDPTLKTGADYSEIIAKYKKEGTPLVSVDHNYVSGCRLLRPPARKTYTHRQIQTDIPEESPCKCGRTHTEVLAVYCCKDGTDVGTQMSIRREPCASPESKHQNARHDAPSEMPQSEGISGKDETDGAHSDSIYEMTGIQPNVFFLLLSLLPSRSKGLSLDTCLRIFLMKLRFGLSFSILGEILSVSRSTASRNFQFVLDNLARSTQDWIIWPPSETVRSSLPPCFSEHPNARCIIDCLEFKTERPPTVKGKALMHSDSKGMYACKALVGYSPHGLISFLSKTFAGGTPDSQITVESSFLDLLEPGDIVVVHSGFPAIETLVAGRQATVVRPPYAVPNQQPKEEDLESINSSSLLWDHVERVVGRLRMYDILNVTFPNELLQFVSVIVHMCAVLANLEESCDAVR